MVRPNLAVKQGSIVWITIGDPRGANPKTRPVIVVSPNDHVGSGTFVTCVAVSGTFTRPVTKGNVELPWNARGSASTGFRKPCVAVCSWVVDVDLDAIQATAYYVPARTLKTILDEVCRLQNKHD